MHGEHIKDIANCNQIPGMMQWFDFPDLCAALAPKFLAINEGGNDSYINKVKRAYEACGCSDHVTITHYPIFSDPASRTYPASMPPYGLDIETYLAHSYVYGPDHSFRVTPTVSLLKRCFDGC